MLQTAVRRCGLSERQRHAAVPVLPDAATRAVRGQEGAEGGHQHRQAGHRLENQHGREGATTDQPATEGGEWLFRDDQSATEGGEWLFRDDQSAAEGGEWLFNDDQCATEGGEWLFRDDQSAAEGGEWLFNDDQCAT